MKNVFSFKKIRSKHFGFVYRPYADVTCFSKDGYARLITMVVDSGADYTILPRREAAILGIDLSQDCIVETTYGVGGIQAVYLYKMLKVRLGDTSLTIPVGFLDTNDVPPLLGRHLFMEQFKTCFENHTVVFEELK